MLPLLAAKGLLRNLFRSMLTLLGVAIAILAFTFLRTTIEAWNAGVEASAQDRLATRHKVSITLPMPRAYFEKVKDRVSGITSVTYANWVGAVDPKDERSFFANFAVDAETYFETYDEVVIAPAQLTEWRSDPTGCIVGEVLAAQKGWKIGDRITLRGTIYPGDLQLTVRGTYGTKRKTFDKSTLFFHWKYLNELADTSRKDQIGFLGIRVADASQGPAVSRAVDDLFANSDTETLTESERAFNLSFLSMFSTVLKALDVVSVVILCIMGLILANTIAMGVRERTHEYGVLRAIGFQPRHLALLVGGEGLVMGIAGGVVGVSASLVVVNLFGKWLEDNFGQFFPYYSMSTTSAVLGLVLAAFIGLIASLVPAWSAARLEVVQALRRL